MVKKIPEKDCSESGLNKFPLKSIPKKINNFPDNGKIPLKINSPVNNSQESFDNGKRDFVKKGLLGLGIGAGAALLSQIPFANAVQYIKPSAGTGINEFSTDGTLAGNSDLTVPTEKAVKTYADAIDTELGNVKDAKFLIGDTTADSDLDNEILSKDVNPTNLLTNGGFELWSAGTSSAPDEWALVGASATVAREASTIKIGTYSAVVTREAVPQSKKPHQEQ